jgi:hypothetical protein
MRIVYGVCTSCPGAETLEVLLENEFDDMTIEYKQWVVTHGAAFMSWAQMFMTYHIYSLALIFMIIWISIQFEWF